MCGRMTLRGWRPSKTGRYRGVFWVGLASVGDVDDVEEENKSGIMTIGTALFV